MSNDKVSGKLTVDEKIAMQTGVGCWNTLALPQHGIPSLTLSDGPVGLRKEVEGKTLTAVCFPSSARLACSFDTELAKEEGQALGEQCLAANVDVLLAPGVNIKRTPFCGRNFEYFSEDPLLAGEIACGYVDGVQSQGVGCCVKHFACNNQEYGRTVCDSIVDDRALREIYLAAFKKVITKSHPWMVMCSYNKINGVYASQNKRLLTDILRNEWGFDGVTVSDWGATDNRVEGIKAGLDLEMPQNRTEQVREAFGGELPEQDLNRAVDRIAKLAMSATRVQKTVDFVRQHKLARKVAAESMVLVKNNCGLLPFSLSDKIAVIGKFAEIPVFQGDGSAHVNAFRPTSLLQALDGAKISYEYSDGCGENGLTKAVEIAEKCEKVVLVVGTKPDCEGLDREWYLPQEQTRLIEAVSSANGNVAVILQCGSSLDVSWSSSVKALLVDYYGGEASGEAAVDVLFGAVSPSGRLCETWPQTLPDRFNSVKLDFRQAEYRESIFVGYRYYSTANCPVAFPFGYGLGYAGVEWTKADVSEPDKKGKIKIRVALENKSKTKQSEVIQVYFRNDDCLAFSAKKNLVAFKKVALKNEQRREVLLEVDVNDLAWYNTDENKFVLGGKYTLWVAKHVNDEKFAFNVRVKGESVGRDRSSELPSYYNVDREFDPSGLEFERLLGRKIPFSCGPISISTPLIDVIHTAVGKSLFKKCTCGREYDGMLHDRTLPLRTFVNRHYDWSTLYIALKAMNQPSLYNVIRFKKAQRNFELAQQMSFEQNRLRERRRMRELVKHKAQSESEQNNPSNAQHPTLNEEKAEIENNLSTKISKERNAAETKRRDVPPTENSSDGVKVAAATAETQTTTRKADKTVSVNKAKNKSELFEQTENANAEDVRAITETAEQTNVVAQLAEKSTVKDKRKGSGKKTSKQLQKTETEAVSQKDKQIKETAIETKKENDVAVEKSENEEKKLEVKVEGKTTSTGKSLDKKKSASSKKSTATSMLDANNKSEQVGKGKRKTRKVNEGETNENL